MSTESRKEANPKDGLENLLNGDFDDPLEALNLLGKLGSIARSTVQDSVRAALKDAPSFAKSPLQTAKTPSTPLPVTSARAEYVPALKDPKLVEALLGFHRLKSKNVQKDSSKKPAVTAPKTTPAPESAFSQEKIPEVNVSPKSTSNSQLKRPPGVTQTVFSDKAKTPIKPPC